MRRSLIIFVLIFLFSFIVLARDFIFFSGLSGRVIPENSSCFLSLAEYIKNLEQDTTLIDLGNSLYGSEQSVYYLLNEPEEFKKFILDFYTSYSIIKCIGEKDLYIEDLLKGLKLFSGNVSSETLNVERYLLSDDFVFIPLSLTATNLIFENFQVAEPFKSLSDIFDSLNITENDSKIVIVGISNMQDINIGSIIEKLDRRVDLVIFQSEFSGIFDIAGKKAIALSNKDVLKLEIHDNNLEYNFETLPKIKTEEFTQELERINSWLEKELAIFMYRPKDYGFNGLNPVNTTAEFLARNFSEIRNAIPLFVFDEARTEQKITIKDVLQIMDNKTIYRTKISGKELEKLINTLLKNNLKFETENINYIVQVNDEKPLKWLRYKGKSILKSSSFELITNMPVSGEMKFEVILQEFLNIFNKRPVSIKYIKNWYVIDSSFEKEFRYYVVDWGDSIGALSILFNKDPKLLMDINGIEDPRELMVGSILIIPIF